jgi:hypothetical protein
MVSLFHVRLLDILPLLLLVTAAQRRPLCTSNTLRARRLSVLPAMALRLRGGIQTRSTAGNKTVGDSAPESQGGRAQRRGSRARARAGSRVRGSRAQERSLDDNGEASGLYHMISEASDDTTVQFNHEDNAVAQLQSEGPVGGSTNVIPADRRDLDDEALQGLAQEAAFVEAQIHAAISLLAGPKSVEGSRADGPSADEEVKSASGAAGAPLGSTREIMEVAVSAADPEVVRAVEEATRIRNFSMGERRARVCVQEGVFEWRGVLPVTGFRQSNDQGPALPVATLLSLCGPRGTENEGGAGAARWGSGGRARLHGDWLLRELSLGAFNHVALVSGPPGAAPASADAHEWQSDDSSDADESSRVGGEEQLGGDEATCGFWARVGGGGAAQGWSGLVCDTGPLRIGVRVQGGPWGFVECDLASEQGIPLMLDDSDDGLRVAGGLEGALDGEEEQDCAGEAQGLGGGQLGARVLVDRCKVGGSQIDIWLREEREGADEEEDAAVAGEGPNNRHNLPNSNPNPNPDPNPNPNPNPNIGACCSAIHVCGRGVAVIRSSLVGACSSAGVVVSEEGRVVMTDSSIERCSLVAFALSAAAEVYVRATAVSAMGCAAVSLASTDSLDQGERVAEQDDDDSRDLAAPPRPALGDLPVPLPSRFHIYTESVEGSEEEVSEHMGKGRRDGVGLRARLCLEACTFRAVPSLWLGDDAPTAEDVHARRVIVCNCSGVYVPSPDHGLPGGEDESVEYVYDSSAADGEEKEEVQHGLAGGLEHARARAEKADGVGAEGPGGERGGGGEEEEEENPFWEEERRDVVRAAEGLLSLLRALNALRREWLERVASLGRAGVLTRPSDPVPPELATEFSALQEQSQIPGATVGREIGAQMKRDLDGVGEGVQVEDAVGEEDDGGGVYRSRRDLKTEMAAVARQVREQMIAEEEGVETFAEQVGKWEQQLAASKGAARRHLGQMALNLTDRHWNVLSPPALSRADLEHLLGELVCAPVCVCVCVCLCVSLCEWF